MNSISNNVYSFPVDPFLLFFFFQSIDCYCYYYWRDIIGAIDSCGIYCRFVTAVRALYPVPSMKIE